VVPEEDLPLLPELAPEELPGGRSGGGGDVIDGDVGDTRALFSLPGPTFPGFAVTPGAVSSFAEGAGDCAEACDAANSAVAATAMDKDLAFIGTIPLAFSRLN
jgi:hypothetical protein